MCGIAGIYTRGDTAPAGLIEAMVEQMVHRGPDDDGYHSEPEVELGMRRLAIIDPAHGKQPLRNEAGDVVVVFNGEIYNHAEIRRGLEERGHHMPSNSDGEILPHLYEELGEGFVDGLNGIFAVALWDRRRQTLHLARDKFGVKPLYWSGDGRRLTFASELKAIVADPELSREVDREAVDHFLTFRFVPAPMTPLRAVRKLRPAGMLSVGPDGVRERTYWTGTMTAARRDRRALIEEYNEAFERAVVRQMMSDRPIGVMLSGGVDSGAITSVMARHSSRVHTFTIGFAEGGDADETGLAAETARMFDTDHHELMVSADEYLRRLPESLLLLEEPVGSSSALAVHYVSELMRPTVPVGLSGQGADEPLGGYWRHLGMNLAHKLRALRPLADAADRLPGRLRSERVMRGARTLGTREPLDALMAAYRVLGEDDKRRLYGPELAAAADPAAPAAEVERLRELVAGLDPVSQMLFVDTRFWLPNELLMIADKMSMAASVELRVPFLDEDLVALVETMHPDQKVRGLSRKSIHKRAMLKWLPKEVVYRKERGWATPMRQWLGAELRPLLEEVLLDSGELAGDLFEERELRRLIEDHAAGRADLTRSLFCLLSLGLWHRQFAAPPAAAHAG